MDVRRVERIGHSNSLTGPDSSDAFGLFVVQAAIQVAVQIAVTFVVASAVVSDIADVVNPGRTMELIVPGMTNNESQPVF